MPYATGRTYFDSDSHIMETIDWLTEHASASEAKLIPAFDPKGAGLLVREAIEKATARRDDEEATKKLLERPLISGPKGWAAYGATTSKERSHALDLLGFEKQLVFPTFALGQFARSKDIEVQYAGAAALNRGMGAFSADDERMMSVGYVPLLDPKRAIATARAAIDGGVKALWVSSNPVGDQSPAHVDLLPFYELLEQEGVPVVLHIGGGKLLPAPYHNNGRPRPSDFLGGGENLRSKDYHSISHSPQNFLACMALDGVFAQFPELRCGVIELGATWVPSFIQTLDHAAHAFRKMEPIVQGLELKPSEYIRRQVRFSLFPYEDAGWLIEQAGPELFMFASDYPHPEGGRDPIGSFTKRLDEREIGEDARESFFSGNFAHLMSIA